MADTFSKWLGDEFLHRFKQEVANNVKRATIHVCNEVKKNISDGYPPASEPGDFPHRRDGELRRSIEWEFDESIMTGRVGSNKVYARYLELGTSNMEARPFLQPTLAKERNTVKRIITRPTNISN